MYTKINLPDFRNYTPDQAYNAIGMALNEHCKNKVQIGMIGNKDTSSIERGQLRRIIGGYQIVRENPLGPFTITTQNALSICSIVVDTNIPNQN
jgi:hypothetical protein